jgi:hypothetical protein
MPILDLSATVEHFASDYTVRRPGAITWTDGRASTGADTTLTVRGVFRPNPGKKDAAQLEGERADGKIKGWVTTALRTSEAGSHAADIVVFQGQDYEVSLVHEAQPQGNYWLVEAEKVGQ